MTTLVTAAVMRSAVMDAARVTAAVMRSAVVDAARVAAVVATIVVVMSRHRCRTVRMAPSRMVGWMVAVGTAPVADEYSWTGKIETRPVVMCIDGKGPRTAKPGHGTVEVGNADIAVVLPAV